MEQLTQYIAKLEAMTGLALVALTCLVLGYVLKLIPKFPNGAVPLVVVLAGMLLTPVIDEGKAANETVRVWLIDHILYGMIVGFCVWTFHAYILKRFEDKIPILGALLNGKNQTGSGSEPPINANKTSDG